MCYIVVSFTSDHLDQVVRVHRCAFPGFFLSFLGPRFLREFYASFLVDPAGRGFVAINPQGRVCGVVVGPLNPAGYFKRLLKRRWWAFCLASASAVVRRPSVILRLGRAVFYRGETPTGPVRALLSSIAVDPVAQGSGVGRLLVERWVEEVHAQGVGGCFLTTDAEDNGAVNAFYRRLGWRLDGDYTTPEGRRMNRYVIDF